MAPPWLEPIAVPPAVSTGAEVVHPTTVDAIAPRTMTVLAAEIRFFIIVPKGFELVGFAVGVSPRASAEFAGHWRARLLVHAQRGRKSVGQMPPVMLAGVLYLGSGVGLLACYAGRALYKRNARTSRWR